MSMDDNQQQRLDRALASIQVSARRQQEIYDKAWEQTMILKETLGEITKTMDENPRKDVPPSSPSDNGVVTVYKAYAQQLESHNLRVALNRHSAQYGQIPWSLLRIELEKQNLEGRLDQYLESAVSPTTSLVAGTWSEILPPHTLGVFNYRATWNQQLTYEGCFFMPEVIAALKARGKPTAVQAHALRIETDLKWEDLDAAFTVAEEKYQRLKKCIM